MTLNPSVLWAQRADRLFVSIQLDAVEDETIVLDENRLTFSGKGGHESKTYYTELNFLKEIVPKESKQKKGGREYFFNIKKKEDGFWTGLLKGKKPAFLKVDFSRWKDEDDSDVDDAPEDGSLEDMMKQMGSSGANPNGFDPGDMADSDDSDDEDLPDLE